VIISQRYQPAISAQQGSAITNISNLKTIASFSARINGAENSRTSASSSNAATQTFELAFWNKVIIKMNKMSVFQEAGTCRHSSSH
jgi:hypothetical protein